LTTCRRRGESGSALVEAAIVIPCLVLILHWSAALTDILVLRLKAAEAARYALWETTVFKPPRQIAAEVQQRFADLRSPRRVGTSHTGLLLHPLADLRWRADVDTTSAAAPLGGQSRLSGGGPWDRFVEALGGALGASVDAAAETMKLNTHGIALARVSLALSRDNDRSPILRGGDLLGLRGGDDLGLPRSATALELHAPSASQRPMQLIFDTWKAWPKPRPYSLIEASTDVVTSPSRTYPEVEKQVSAQTRAIAFFGADRIPGFRELNDLVGRVFRLGVTQSIAGGRLPDVFSTGRMDDLTGNRGPITILPPERPGPSWVPQLCEIAGRNVPCPTQRAGDVTTAQSSARPLDEAHGVGDGVDRTRYTLPYRIQTAYWRRPGGVGRELDSRELQPIDPRLATENEYVKSYRCRGHFFGGSRTAQRPNAWGSCG
jgi:hypothetical protein